MVVLTNAQHVSRRVLDYRLVSRLPVDCAARVFAYANREAVQRGEVIEPAAGEGGHATHYLAELKFPVLTGPRKTTKLTHILFDASGEAYPFAAPHTQVVSAPLPWNPHVHPASGVVCLGEAWSLARGRMTLVNLVAHVCRILNCDEPDRGEHYGGWQPEAVAYWRTKMSRQPLNQGLRYPVLPVEVTHGISVDRAATAFAPVPDSGFIALGAGASDVDFMPVGSAA